MANFFDKTTDLKLEKIKSHKTSYIGSSIFDILAKECCDEKFKLLVVSMNKIEFSRIEDAKPLCDIQEKYVLEARAFNIHKEIYIKKIANGYEIRVISDGDGEDIEIVDAKSNFLGKRVGNIEDGFAVMYEDGRKIRMVLPVDSANEHYSLLTRSYITFDEETAQAGFGYYRYIDIVESEKCRRE